MRLPVDEIEANLKDEDVLNQSTEQQSEMKVDANTQRSREEKFVLIFEAARRSLLASNHYLDTIFAQLPDAERRILHQETDGNFVAPLLLASLGFVDFAHRFGELVEQLPFLNAKEPEPRELREVLGSIEVARNHLQHMRGDLSTNEKIDYPLLGTLSWSHDDISFTIHLSQPSPSTAASMAFDINGRWVSRIQLNLKNIILDFDKIMKAMQRTYSWIVTKVRFSDPMIADLKWGAPNAFWMKIAVNREGEGQISGIEIVASDLKSNPKTG